MFPDIIKKIPARNYGIDGLKVHVDHTPRSGIVVTGSCTFTANGETKTYSAGETYFIPAGLNHR